jgi:folate-binding protein YgfZ
MRSLPLESVHLDAGAKLGEVGDAEGVLSYGDGPEDALRARQSLALWDRSHEATLVVTGPDRVSWLQGMVTNDVQRLAVGQGCRAAVVTSKGRMVADVRVYKRHDEIWLETSADRAEALRTHLNRFIIMEDCQVEERSTEFALLSLLGPKALGCLRDIAGAPELLAESTQFAQVDVRLPTLAELPVIVASSDEAGFPRFDLRVHPTAAETVWREFLGAGARPIGFDAAEVLRIEQGRPRFGAELDEETLPLEAGLKDEISYDKGCYVGQEIVARVTYRGHVNRELRGLLFQGEPPPTPSPLTHGAEAAGELRSTARSAWIGRTIGLGLLKREAWADGTKVTLPGGREAVVTSLPFKPVLEGC